MAIVRRSVWAKVQIHTWKFTKRTRPVRGAVIHTTRGNQGYPGKKEISAFENWVISPNNRNTRAGAPAAGISNYGVGPDLILEVIPEEYEARFSSHPADTVAISIEVAQSNKGQAIEPETIAACVVLVRELAARYGFPLERVTNPPNDRDWTGLIGHEDTKQGRAQGKSDPGPEFWGPFMAALNQEEHMPTPEYEALLARIEDLELALAAAGEEKGKDGKPLPRGERQLKARMRITEAAKGNQQSYGDQASSAVVLAKQALAASGGGIAPGTKFNFTGEVTK